MYNPVASYRLQFNKEFSFAEFEKIIPYLVQLGISTVYASPLLESTPGSTHGYDAINPHRIDPEIGDQEGLSRIRKELDANGIGWIQDIVPNHMAFDPSNPWLMDVLEKGQMSRYANFFDIAWNTPLFEGKIMVPFLGAPLENVIEDGEIKIKYVDKRLVLNYHDTNYPLRPRSYAQLLDVGEGQPPTDNIRQLIEQMEQLESVEDPASYDEAWEELRQQLASIMKLDDAQRYIRQRLDKVNKSHKSLQLLADQQSYRLCDWQETDSQINFRRFFTINGLICLNIQDDEVFSHYHAFIKTLVDANVIQGLRIDHIDGLYDPTDYLDQLRKMVGNDTYIVVEKILEAGETLPRWPIQGTTGYDFLAQVNNLFTNKNSEDAFTGFYQRLIGKSIKPAQMQREKKELILNEYMAGELENLYQLFLNLNLVEKRVLAAIHRDDMKDAIAEFLIQCPVYRYYGNRFPLVAEEATAIEQLLFRVRRYDPDLHQAVNILEDVFLRKPHQGDSDWNSRALYFYQRCMQFTGPLMAKGVEDTFMYVYNRFVGHNEVGDSPEAFGCTVDEFHQLMQTRQLHWPHSLNATSTHDTKRGEDSRARLNVLTDLPDEWFEKVKEWQNLANGPQTDADPDINDTYFIYQTLVAAYPMPGDSKEEQTFGNRLEEYLQKALREAKVHSNWAEPNEEYESATTDFASGLLDKKSAFWASFEPFYQKIADHGIVNSFAQTILKFTAPGVPDVYQGCELWDLSMVDPDNRRTVDFDQRQQWLTDMMEHEEPQALVQELWENRFDGRIKLWLHQQLFSMRQQHPELFLNGDYLPLTVEGTYKDHVIAFIRQHRRHCTLVALPLHTARLCQEQDTDILNLDWKDTKIVLPEGTPDEWEALASSEPGMFRGSMAVQSLFTSLPFAIMKGLPINKDRSAGILLHISSLASPFGIGDMGPEALAFANFLERSNQRYWQLLPLNSVEEKQGYSPYSATSSRAGNIWLISPELLAREGLLPKSKLPDYYIKQDGTTRYAEVEQVKTELFQQAYKAFCALTETIHDDAFRLFCEDNHTWLDDFALYSILKDQLKGKAWHEWPTAYKQREPKALQKLATENADEIQKVKWLQYIFFKQWKQLKTYCNKRDIELLGDLPIYVSYDSADVWVHREFFHLDEEGKLTGIAGVPPDAFSDDGQLWGMPVYRWDILRQQGYAWWIDRIQKNMELFDLVRLDHFRGFSSYWEVPGGEKNAVNGAWVEGPGADFFNAVQEALGHLPFVAEDLGDIDAAVLELRDQFELPGMKVLHFAFSENMPQNEYIPHNHAPNFVTYTGTHDNNTTRGWYRQDIDQATRTRLEQYAGREINEHIIHQVLARMAYASVAKIAILPIQDVLGLDEKARMNTPASTELNWSWRLQPGQITETSQKQLRLWSWLFNRD